MGIGDFFSGVSRGFSSIGSRIGEGLKTGAMRIGDFVNQAARMGQKIRSKVEQAADKIAAVPFIGHALKTTWDKSPLKSMYEKGSAQLDSIERISDKTRQGEFKQALQETANNPYVRQQLAKYADKLDYLPPQIRDEINQFLQPQADSQAFAAVQQARQRMKK